MYQSLHKTFTGKNTIMNSLSRLELLDYHEQIANDGTLMNN